MPALAHAPSEQWTRNWRAPSVAWFAAFTVYVAWSWRPALSIDEAATTVVVRSGWRSVWRLARDDVAMGPYYLLMKPWSEVSSSTGWLRLLSVLAAATAAAALFVFVRGVMGPPAAMAAAATMVLLPGVSRFAQYARPYAVTMLVCVLAVGLWWTYVRSGELRFATGFAAAVAVAGLAHVYALLLVAVLVLTVAIAPLEGRRGDLVRTLVPAGVAVAAISPFLVAVAHARGAPAPPTASVTNVAYVLTSLVTGGSGRWAVAACVALLLVAGAGFVLGWLSCGEGRTLGVLGAAWLALPPLALVVFQVVTDKPGLVPRYWAFVLPAVALGIGLAVSAVPLARAVWVVAGAAILLGASWVPHCSIRGADSHDGVRYESLAAAVELPGLHPLPVLIRSAYYRALIANAPGLPPSRVPLVAPRPDRPMDPIHPEPLATRSEVFKELVRTQPVVLAFQPRKQGRHAIPTAASFTSFRRELRSYPVPLVLCAFDGDALGLFAQSGAATSAQKEEIAAQIERISPSTITCDAVPWSTG